MADGSGTVERTMRLEQIRIERLRGIAEREISELTDVNVLLGPPGTGMTTILEAIAILASGGNPNQSLADLYLNREIAAKKTNPDAWWKLLFHQCDTTQPIMISGTEGDHQHQASITMTPARNTGPSATAKDPGKYGNCKLGLRYRKTKGQEAQWDEPWESDLNFETSRGKVVAWGYETEVAAPVTRLWPHSRGETEVDIERYGALVRRSAEKVGDVLEGVRHVMPQIESVGLATVYRNRCRLYIRTEHGDNLPAAMCGNELMHALRIAIAAASHQKGLLLADDVGAGCGAGGLQAVGTSLARASRNGQVFVTAGANEADAIVEWAKRAGAAAKLHGEGS